MSGIMLCGTTITVTGITGLFAEILAVSGLGASRVSVPGTSSADVTAGWETMIFSCLAKLDPFRVTISFSPNYDWKTAIKAAPATTTITWPIYTGNTTAATLAMSAGLTQYTFGGELQGRLVAETTVTPSGAPTITPGT